MSTKLLANMLSVVMPHVLSVTYPGSVSFCFALQRLVLFDIASPDFTLRFSGRNLTLSRSDSSID